MKLRPHQPRCTTEFAAPLHGTRATRARRFAGGLALLAACGCSAPAWAGDGSAPLQCQRATLIPLRTCPAGAICGAGDGPGMSQLTGSPSNLFGATGWAAAGGYSFGSNGFSSARDVWGAYTVPDVRKFSTSTTPTNDMPVTTRTWVVKSTTLPGVYTPVAVKFHAMGTTPDNGTSQSFTTTTAGNASLTGSWLLVGQVEALVVVKGAYITTTYGFSCKLPVQNLILQNQLY